MHRGETTNETTHSGASGLAECEGAEPYFEPSLAGPLARHRALAERTGAAVVYVRFRLAAPAGRDAWRFVELLAEVVLRRCRLSDVAGWDDTVEDAVGLILPGARHQDAILVIHRIETALAQASRTQFGPDAARPELVCEVYWHPEAAQSRGPATGRRGTRAGHAHPDAEREAARWRR